MDFDPSKPLLAPKQERFAILVARGLTQAAAYVQAGYSPAGAHVNASVLARTAHVKARIDWLRAQVGARTTALVIQHAVKREERAEAASEAVIEAALANREWIMAALVENAEICLGRRPLTMLKAIKGKRVDGVETVEVVEVQVTERDAAGANRALELLGKELGMPFDGTQRAPGGLTASIQTVDDDSMVILLDKIRARKTA